MNTSSSTSEKTLNVQPTELPSQSTVTAAPGANRGNTDRPRTRVPKARSGFAITDLLQLRIALDHTSSVEAACQVFAERIANFFDCQNVFVSLRQESGSLKLLGEECVSEDRRVEASRILSAQMETSADHNRVGWPECDEWQPSLIHQALVVEPYDSAVSIRMPSQNEETIGVVTVLGDQATCRRVVEHIEHLIGLAIPHFELQLKAERTVTQRLRAYLSGLLSARIKWGIALVCVLMLFFVRVPLNVSCDVEVKPVVRRYVAAPFDGVLKSSRVRAGDSVAAGTTLASLDEDEIFLQKSSVEAEIEKFRKQKSAALANGETLAMQQAQLEFKRMTYKNDLLDQRSSNLAIVSPIDGVVLKNGLEDAEGAPLKQGQMIFEIAPLNRMIFNIYVSQTDIAYVEQGMKVRVRVDACQRTFEGKIARIRPQAEMYEDDSVFVAEVEFENEDGLIRPGMRGYAKIHGKHHSIGWVLFRKPVGFLQRLTGF